MDEMATIKVILLEIFKRMHIAFEVRAVQLLYISSTADLEYTKFDGNCETVW